MILISLIYLTNFQIKFVPQLQMALQLDTHAVLFKIVLSLYPMSRNGFVNCISSLTLSVLS